MKEIKYQQKYVRKLVDETIDLLRLSGHRKTLIFKAPTGSGKTVMASQLLLSCPASPTHRPDGIRRHEPRVSDVTPEMLQNT